MVQIYVSKLRRLLAPGQLHTRPPGYSLQLEPDALDLHRFERVVAEARASLDAGRAEQASDRFRAALALWRGPALAEFSSEPFARRRGGGSRSSASPRSKGGSRQISGSAVTVTSSASSRR